MNPLVLKLNFSYINQNNFDKTVISFKTKKKIVRYREIQQSLLYFFLAKWSKILIYSFQRYLQCNFDTQGLQKK